MECEILLPKGYCAGVNNAINIALRAKKENMDKNVYVFGMLVHNQITVDELTAKGIITLKGKSIDELDNLKPGDIIIFTAHGHDPLLDRIAKEKGLIIYDAICRKVKENLNYIDEYAKLNKQIIYIGIKGHPETESALKWNNNVFLYDYHLKDFDYSLIKDESPLVINQTTLNFDELKDIHTSILNHLPKAKILNEICAATRIRQEAVKSIAQDVDLIIILGDKKSSNSNKLFEIAKTHHQNALSIMISNLEELDLKLVKNKKKAVIASGASTPESLITATYNIIKSI